jgi:hypothetical protein
VRTLTRRLSRLKQLEATEKRTLLTAAGCLPLFWLAVRVVGLKTFHRWLRGAKRDSAVPAPTHEAMRRLAALIDMAANTLGPDNCLSKSLLLDWLLHRQGIESELRIGVELLSGRLSAHAWVEVDGVPINDRADIAQSYAPFAAIAPASAFRRP